MFDNEFTNAPATGADVVTAAHPIQPKPPVSSKHTFWIIDNNQVDGKPAGADALMDAPSNVKVYDIDALAPSKPTVPPSPITPATVFLKTVWPTPGKIFDVTSFGANGSHPGDDTVGIQAAIDAAAKAGQGAMAYLPAGSYMINTSLTVTGDDF